MSFLGRLLGTSRDPREEWRPLWHEVVRVSREPEWYAQCDVADSIDGRFDMISVVLSLALLRMERDEALAPATAYLTELFVEDMDRQLRETGVGDLMVGKNIGKLMAALGGRLGALRETLATSDDAPLAEALARNVALVGDAAPRALAARVRLMHYELATADAVQLKAGRLRR